jgi:5-methylcytosine-specific restriction endonuclease McrA
MNAGIPKRRRVRLDPERYRELKMKILERDGWKCQRCGRGDQLQIHHQVRRSQSGADCEENLIVLCSGCHGSHHAGSSGKVFVHAEVLR